MSPSVSSSRLESVRNIFRGNQDLLRNAGTLAATTGVTSFCGFAYWIYAARGFSTVAVGYGAAAISTMILLGTLGMFGLDSMLMGELPRGGNQGGLTMASCIVSFFLSFVLGLGFSLVSLAFGTHFIQINGTVGRIAIFSFGVALTGATSVFDSATIGLLRGGLQLSRNVAVSVAKLAALSVIALVLHGAFGVGIIVAWVIGIVISLLAVAVMIKRGGGRILHRPDWDNLWRLRKLVAAHTRLNLSITVPVKLLPVLVAIVVTPGENGAFYIASMIYSFLFMMGPQSLSAVLYAVSSAAPEKIAEKLRFVLRMSLIIGVPGVLGIGLFAHYILSVFNPKYAPLATVPLWLLLLGYFPGLPNTTYVAVARVQGRFNQATTFLTAFAALRMIAVVAGGEMDGLFGLSMAMLVATLMQALFTAPPVLRTAFGSVAVPAAVDSAAVSAGQSQAVTEDSRQEEGIAALIKLATRTAQYRVWSETDALELGAYTQAWERPSVSRRSEKAASGKHRDPLPNALAVTGNNRAISDTNWWPDVNETAFRQRQEMGVAALISIATDAAKF